MTNKRFVTTWTSEDYVQYKLYIIPSNADYSSGSVDQTLPADFLLQDMKLESSIGELPAGIHSSILKLTVNIASCEGTADLDNLREQLLQGTTTKLVPLNSNGTEYLVGENLGYHEELTEEQRQFDVFNTFVLLYNDGFGFTPNVWKLAFIGCQKYASENELEVTSLQNVIKFSIEAHDMTRCIGEMITPEVWTVALRAKDEMINLTSTMSKSEVTEYREVLIGKNYFYAGQYDRPLNAVDLVNGRFWFYVSTFDRLATKISQMFSAYFRAIVRNNSSVYTFPQIFDKTIAFRKDFSTYIGQDYLCYIAEIWESVAGTGIRLVSGAHYDSKMFGAYTNFYEVLKSLCESCLEIYVPQLTLTSGNPDIYSIVFQSSYPLAETNVSTIEMNQDNTFSSYKMKMLSESLRYASLSVTSITGDADTTEYVWGDKGTSSDNSKEMKIMFHNLPILTDRKTVERYYGVWDNQDLSWIRRTINSGIILYFEDSTPHLPRKVYTACNISFDADTPYFTNDYTKEIPILPTNTPDAELLMILEQQFSGLPTTIAYAMVELFGSRKQATGELTMRFVDLKSSDVGKRCKVNLTNYNSLLQKIYNANIVKAMIMETTHDIYQGTTDVSIRIDAE